MNGRKNFAGDRRPPAIPIMIVAAVAENGGIGRSDGLPWRLKSDLQHFRRLTWGKPVILGRRTYVSIRRALPGRTNIVVSRNREFCAPGVIVAADLKIALALGRADALRRAADAIAVIGGADIYAQAMPLAQTIILTLVHLHADADIRFPPIDRNMWEEAGRIEHPQGPGDDASFALITYHRR